MMLRPFHKRRREIGFGLFLIIFLAGCARKPDPVPSWAFAPKGIEITCTADNILNAWDNKPHTLLLVLYQLENINAFQRFAGYREGIEKLLEAQSFDPSAMAVEKRIIEPATVKTVVLNRAENARWIGVVAGYYDLVPEKTTRVFEFSYDIKTSGLIRKTTEAQVKTLKVNLLLGPNGIQEIKRP